MKTPLRTNRIISNITQSSVIYGTEANAIDALQLSLDSPTPLGGDRWCWDGRQWIRLNVIDLGSKYYLGLLLSQESGNIQVYKAHGDIIGEGGGKLNGLTFEFLSSEDANDTATQLITAEGGNAIVVANPTLDGTESELTGLQVDQTKYKITQVIPNSTAAASDEDLLNTLRIGNILYFAHRNIEIIIDDASVVYDSDNDKAWLSDSVGNDIGETMVNSLGIKAQVIGSNQTVKCIGTTYPTQDAWGFCIQSGVFNQTPPVAFGAYMDTTGYDSTHHFALTMQMLNQDLTPAVASGQMGFKLIFSI